MRRALEGMKGIELASTTVTIKTTPDADALASLERLADEMAK